MSLSPAATLPSSTTATASLHGDKSPPQTSGAATSSPSARTSFTRVGVLSEDEAMARSSPVSQDHQIVPDTSLPLPPPPDQLSEPQGPDSAAVTSPSTPTTTSHEPETAVPMPSTTTTSAAHESATSSASQKVLTVQQQQDAVVPQTPQAFVTFLLVSGKRRTMSFEPETAIGRVKELIWNAWPTEWQDERPPAPSYLRVLYLGKMLLDDDTLNKLKIQASLPTAPQPTIVHLSIRPYNPSGEDGTIKKKRKNSDALTGPDHGNATGCCGCIIC